MTAPKKPFAQTTFWEELSSFLAVLEEDTTTDQIVEALREVVLTLNGLTRGAVHRSLPESKFLMRDHDGGLWAGVHGVKPWAHMLLMVNSRPLKPNHTYPSGTELTLAHGRWDGQAYEEVELPDSMYRALREIFTAHLQLQLNDKRI